MQLKTFIQTAALFGTAIASVRPGLINRGLDNTNIGLPLHVNDTTMALHPNHVNMTIKANRHKPGYGSGE